MKRGKTEKRWMFQPAKSEKVKPTELEKKEISERCQPLVEALKKKYIKSKPNKEWSYLVDIYTSWYRSYFYFCEKSKSENPNRIQDEFDEKFARLTFTGKDCFDFSYFRHTGQWWLIAENVTLQECLKMIIENPNFQPIG